MTSDIFPQFPSSYWIESTQIPAFPPLSEI